MDDLKSYAEVIVDLSARRTDRIFHYAVPRDYREKIFAGSWVRVPFGNRQLTGYVVGFSIPAATIDTREVAEILDVEPVVTPELLELARWMADNYFCSTAEALKSILSPRLKVKKGKWIELLRPALPHKELLKALAGMERSPKQAAVLRMAMEQPGLTRKELASAAETTVSTVNILISKGMLELCRETVSARQAQRLGRGMDTGCPVLNGAQKNASEQVKAAILKGVFNVFLLHGVTGSGKTEVYLQAVAEAVRAGRQTVTLVPEISLTPQMIDLYRARFGERVVVLHSGLTGSDRHAAWQQVKSGVAPVVLGTRSAVFAPMPRPGLFVLDEEHESSYKQDDHLRYHAREVAIKRAQMAGAVVVLGSATPSLESLVRASSGGPYRLLELPCRVDGRHLPAIRVVDMRDEIRSGNRGIFSRELKEAITVRIARNEQVLLFINRRGYANFVMCRECGQAIKCNYCDISLTYHLDGRVCCHYCGFSTFLPAQCPLCGSDCIRHFGAGTQKVEEEVRRLLPGAVIVRMDSDSTARRGSHEMLLNKVRERQADVLIGTQMIAKGLDLPGITLVGVVNADTMLHMPDFRAAERTFQLMTQVSGRAGRGDLAGEVLVQTYHPEHYSITAAVSYNSETFYRSELSARRQLKYPPFSYLARLLFTHELEEEASRGALQAKEMLLGMINHGEKTIDLLGPAPAPLSRIKNRYRWQLVLKGSRRIDLKNILQALLAGFEQKPLRAFKPAVSVDINPQGML